MTTSFPSRVTLKLSSLKDTYFFTGNINKLLQKFWSKQCQMMYIQFYIIEAYRKLHGYILAILYWKVNLKETVWLYLENFDFETSTKLAVSNGRWLRKTDVSPCLFTFHSRTFFLRQHQLVYFGGWLSNAFIMLLHAMLTAVITYK